VNDTWDELIETRKGLRFTAALVFPPFRSKVKEMKKFLQELEDFYFKAEWLSMHASEIGKIKGKDIQSFRDLIVHIELSKRIAARKVNIALV
jgi:hypothetical protein